MIWLKRKQNKKRPLPPLILKAAEFLKQRLKRFADQLQQKSNRISRSRLKWILFLFCVLYIGGSVYAFLTSLHPKNNTYPVIPNPVLSLKRENVKRPTLSPLELTKIHQFRLYLDSLNSTVQGKVFRDSFLNSHPGFLDTLHYLENLYQQNKN